jgi:negative regulator of flagellin synthesis FlgM
MKVNDQSAFINFDAHTQRPHDASSNPAAASNTASERASTDKVVLSPKARELQDARAQLDNLASIDGQRVAHIQLQIEKGTYKIDGGKIAERMLGEMRLNSGL